MINDNIYGTDLAISNLCRNSKMETMHSNAVHDDSAAKIKHKYNCTADIIGSTGPATQQNSYSVRT
jgi:hypothetical protein